MWTGNASPLLMQTPPKPALYNMPKLSHAHLKHPGCCMLHCLSLPGHQSPVIRRHTCPLSQQVTDWLDFVLGKSDQPPSFMRREGPPERKRKKKLGEGSGGGGGGGGSSSRGTPPASLAAGGGSARAAFGGGGPRSGPFGQVRGLTVRAEAGTCLAVVDEGFVRGAGGLGLPVIYSSYVTLLTQLMADGLVNTSSRASTPSSTVLLLLL